MPLLGMDEPHIIQVTNSIGCKVNTVVELRRQLQVKLNCSSQFKPADNIKHSCWRRSHKIHFTPKPEIYCSS